MGSYTKLQRKQLSEVEAKILDGYRRGVCDIDGFSVRNDNGIFVAKPRGGYVTFRKVYPRHAQGE